MSLPNDSRPGIENDTEATADQSEARPKPANSNDTWRGRFFAPLFRWADVEDGAADGWVV